MLTFKRSVAFIVCLVMVVSLFTACGSSNQNSGNTEQTKQEASQQTTVAEQSNGSDATFDPDSEKDVIDYSKLTEKFGETPKPKDGLKVGAVMKTLANEYWQLLAKGYENEAKKYNLQIDVQAAQSESNASEQLQVAETMLNKKYDVLMLSPQSNINLAPAVEEAKGLNVPIINVEDSIIPDAQVFVGPIQKDNGVSAAKYMAEKLGETGEVAIIEGSAGVYCAKQRTDGFKETIAKYSNMKLVASVPADWDRQKALDVTTDLIYKNPNLKGIYCNNDTMALGAVEAVKSAGKLGQIIIIGTDGIDAAYESIKKGELTGTIDSFPVETGEVAIDVMLRIMGGQKIPRVVATPQALVTKDNMAQYKK